MGLPLKSWFEVKDAVGNVAMDRTTTARIPPLGTEMPEWANSIVLEIVGASTPSWTVDIQGRTHQNGTYTNWEYEQILTTAAAKSVAQLSVTDTTLRFYVIPRSAPFMQIIATRTSGTLAIRGYYTSEVLTQELLTNAEGAIRSTLRSSATTGAIYDLLSNAGSIASGVNLLGVAALIYGLDPGGGTSRNRLIAGNDNGDGVANRAAVDMLRVVNQNFRYSGGAVDAWDREYNITRTAYLASSARTATTNGADRTNYNFRGLAIHWNVTAVGAAPSVTMAIQVKDMTSGNYVSVYTAALALSTTGQRVYHLRLAAENTEGWTETFLGGIGARTYRVIFTHGNTDSITYSVDIIEEP